jgi:hypothetical protein
MQMQQPAMHICCTRHITSIQHLTCRCGMHACKPTSTKPCQNPTNF